MMLNPKFTDMRRKRNRAYRRQKSYRVSRGGIRL